MELLDRTVALPMAESILAYVEHIAQEEGQALLPYRADAAGLYLVSEQPHWYDSSPILCQLFFTIPQLSHGGQTSVMEQIDDLLTLIINYLRLIFAMQLHGIQYTRDIRRFSDSYFMMGRSHVQRYLYLLHQANGLPLRQSHFPYPCPHREDWPDTLSNVV